MPSSNDKQKTHLSDATLLNDGRRLDSARLRRRLKHTMQINWEISMSCNLAGLVIRLIVDWKKVKIGRFESLALVFGSNVRGGTQKKVPWLTDFAHFYDLQTCQPNSIKVL